MEFGEIQNPPSAPTPPDLPEEAQSKQRPADEEEKDRGDDFPGELAPAGA